MLVFRNGTMEWVQRDSNVPSVEGAEGYPQMFDEDGNIIEMGTVAESSVCYIEALAYNEHAKTEQGDYKNASYVIYLDMDSVPDVFKPVTVRLIHEDKGDLGEFQVLRYEFYRLTRTIQVWV